MTPEQIAEQREDQRHVRRLKVGTAVAAAAVALVYLAMYVIDAWGRSR